MSVQTLRATYHRRICANILGTRESAKLGMLVPTNADIDMLSSVKIAERLVQLLGYPTCSRPPVGQTAGRLFAEYTMALLRDSFALLEHLRPGKWCFSVSQERAGIAAFDQYEHLAILDQVLAENDDLAAALGSGYLVTPDITVGRAPCSDEEINTHAPVLEAQGSAARLTPLREVNRAKPLLILHASISCKWTIRSDRSQNTRTEALNLIRSRKGHTPHIVAVTAEPLPTRLASLALGTGDIDCLYHLALPELQQAAQDCGNDDQADMLKTLVHGRRLRDISDLPFELAV
jgi:hypothetical protein